MADGEAPPEPDYGKINGLLEDKEVEVHVSEADMRDPALLAELAALSGDVVAPAPALAPAAAERAQRKQAKEKEIAQVEQQIKAEKTRAVMKKREGDITGAKESMRNYKNLEVHYKQMQEELAGLGAAPAPAPVATSASTAVSAPAAPAPAQKGGEDEIDVEAIRAALADPIEDEVHVEVTDADMNDPVLAAELAALAGDGPPPPAPASQQAASRTVSASAPPASSPAAGAGAEGGVVESMSAAEAAELAALMRGDTGDGGLEQMKKDIVATKRRVLAFKKAGNMPAASEELKKAKAMQRELNELEQLMAPEPEPVEETPAEELSIEEVMRLEAEEERKRAKLKREKADREKALAEKNAAEARVREAARPKSNDEVYDSLTEALNNQIAILKTLARAAYDVGDKMGALDYNKQRKNMEKDLISLRQARMGGLEVPRVVSEDRTFSYERVFTKLTDAEISVEVIRCIGLKLPAGYTDITPYVYVDHPYPEGRGPTATTPAGKSVDPVFDFVTVFPVEPRRLERKKVTFEVLQSRFLRTSLSIGKATVPLAALSNSAEIHEVFELYPPKTRKSAGKIEVRIRARSSLSGKDMQSIQERWLMIESYNKTLSLPSLALADTTTPAASRPPPTSGAARAPGGPPAAATPAGAVAPGGAAVAPAPAPVPGGPPGPAPAPIPGGPPALAPAPPAPAAAQKKEAKEPEGAVDEDMYDPNSVDHMISNNVLEWEAARLQQLIRAAKSRGESTEDLEFQASNCQIKMTILVSQVQTGVLTVPKYRQQLVAKIKVELQQALKYKKAGKKEWAVLAMKRKKLMEEEVATLPAEDAV